MLKLPEASAEEIIANLIGALAVTDLSDYGGYPTSEEVNLFLIKNKFRLGEILGRFYYFVSSRLSKTGSDDV